MLVIFFIYILKKVDLLVGSFQNNLVLNFGKTRKSCVVVDGFSKSILCFEKVSWSSFIKLSCLVEYLSALFSVKIPTQCIYVLLGILVIENTQNPVNGHIVSLFSIFLLDSSQVLLPYEHSVECLPENLEKPDCSNNSAFQRIRR